MFGEDTPCADYVLSKNTEIQLSNMSSSIRALARRLTNTHNGSYENEVLRRRW
jgi:hypothetical protein